jgi:hypothetical protein
MVRHGKRRKHEKLGVNGCKVVGAVAKYWIHVVPHVVISNYNKSNRKGLTKTQVMSTDEQSPKK